MKNKIRLCLAVLFVVTICSGCEKEDESFLIYSLNGEKLCTDDLNGAYHSEVNVQGFTTHFYWGFSHGGGYFWTLGVNGWEGQIFIVKIDRISPDGTLTEFPAPPELTYLGGSWEVGFDYADDYLWIALDNYNPIKIYRVDPITLETELKYLINIDDYANMYCMAIDENEDIIYLAIGEAVLNYFSKYDLYSGEYLGRIDCSYPMILEMATSSDYIWIVAPSLHRIDKRTGEIIFIDAIAGADGIAF